MNLTFKYTQRELTNTKTNILEVTAGAQYPAERADRNQSLSPSALRQAFRSGTKEFVISSKMIQSYSDELTFCKSCEYALPYIISTAFLT